MIERAIITQNPVTQWGGDFTAEYGYSPKGDRGGFSAVDYTVRRLGGAWDGLLTIHDDPAYLAELYRTSLGRDVKLEGTNGTRLNYFINGMRLHLGGGLVKYISLDTMANQVWARYRDASAAEAFGRTTVATNANSIARWGKKDFPLQGGRAPSSSVAQGVANRVVRRMAFPKSYIQGLGATTQGQKKQDEVRLELVLDGYIKTLKWRVYNQTASSGTQSADLEIADILTAVGQFIATPWFIKANTIAARKDFDADQWAWDIIAGIVASGDTIFDPWTFYLDEYRRPHYEPWTPSIDREL